VSTTFSAAALKARALAAGFNLVGITQAAPSPTLDAYLRWAEAGMHGNMGYMARPDRVARRRDLDVILPGARSLVIVGMDYRVSVPQDMLADSSRGRIASYAWNLDYHDVMEPMLEELAGWVQATYQRQTGYKVYVDTGAILERSHAQQAGMGFIGKNTMLIHPRRGSYFFLGEIITDIPFDSYDTPGRDTMCGNCTRCLSACPTDAFRSPMYWTHDDASAITPLRTSGPSHTSCEQTSATGYMAVTFAKRYARGSAFRSQRHETHTFPTTLTRSRRHSSTCSH
jgi:epoxyqueuosine reductase